MFDWFKDTALELGGVDTKALKKEKEEKKRLEKENRYIFSKKTKIMIVIVGLLYLLMTGSVMVVVRGEGVSAGYLVKSIFLSVVDIGAIFALLVGKKKGEIVALVLVFIFVITMYLSVYLM